MESSRLLGGIALGKVGQWLGHHTRDLARFRIVGTETRSARQCEHGDPQTPKFLLEFSDRPRVHVVNQQVEHGWIAATGLCRLDRLFHQSQAPLWKRPGIVIAKGGHAPGMYVGLATIAFGPDNHGLAVSHLMPLLRGLSGQE